LDLEISFDTKGKDYAEIFRKIKKDAEDFGIKMSGTAEKGNFLAFATAGRYEFSGGRFTAYIYRKPGMVSDSMIKEGLEKYFK